MDEGAFRPLLKGARQGTSEMYFIWFPKVDLLEIKETFFVRGKFQVVNPQQGCHEDYKGSMTLSPLGALEWSLWIQLNSMRSQRFLDFFPAGSVWMKSRM